MTRGGAGGAGDPAPAAPFLFPTGRHYLASAIWRRLNQGLGYDPRPRRGVQAAAVGGPISPASSEVGSSSQEPPHDCLDPRGEPAFTPTSSKGSSPLQKDLGAGLEGRVRDAIVSSPQREAGPLGGCLGSSGPLSELSPTLLIRPSSAGSAPRPGRSRRRAHGRGRTRPGASKWPRRKSLFLQPLL